LSICALVYKSFPDRQFVSVASQYDNADTFPFFTSRFHTVLNVQSTITFGPTWRSKLFAREVVFVAIGIVPLVILPVTNELILLHQFPVLSHTRGVHAAVCI